MTKRMLVDATHPEETRVAIADGNWLSDFDFERASKKQLKGNIYLAKVIRIEPSLQAAFVEYGGNRHGFLPFSEIHPDYFRIPMADRPPDAPESEVEIEEEAEGEEPAAENYEPDERETAPDDAAADTDTDERELAEGEEPAASEPLSETELPPESEASPATYAETSYPETQAPIPEFSHEPANDLGLITDFGNAAIGSVPGLASEPTPVETVGGEVAEEEQRPRYQPRPRYKIQEVVKRRQVMLIQVVKEERGNKGAALTTFLSLAGRYCVLMPNSENGGGVSRKITSHQDRRRMKEMLDQLEIPEGMAVILRTAGMEQDPAEIQRDLEYLLRLWNGIREQTLQSTAPALIYEEANLIKRSLRDLYGRDLAEILVAGTRGHQLAIDFMRTIMPDQIDKVKLYEDPVPLFFRFNVEKQIDQLYNPTVQLRSGGYIVINPTEALVSIDVNSGRATRERHIESTALKTNLEAADEIARQLRLRDLAGLVVIDFIDMEDGRNNAAVERRLKEAMRADRARLQIGRISPFGLLELSRQRLHPSLMEINFEKCPHCAGIGLVRSIDSAAISILRMIEEEGIKNGAAELVLHVPTKVALYILNQKRAALSEIERRYDLQLLLHSDDELVPPDFRLERPKGGGETRGRAPAVNTDQIFAETDSERPVPSAVEPAESRTEPMREGGDTAGDQRGSRRRGRYGFGRSRNNRQNQQAPQAQQAYPPQSDDEVSPGNVAEAEPNDENDSIGNTEAASYSSTVPDGTSQDQQRRGGRRRGRRGGRGRRNGQGVGGQDRPPRDNNYRSREQRPNNYRPYEPASAPEPMAASPAIPASIHDIDTTPRVEPVSRSSFTAPPEQPAREPRSATSGPPPYEVVQTTDKPKGGWWKKLTGGE
jgi:ribonuclease E